MTITTEFASDMISPKLFTEFQQLNEEQRRIVLHDQGPMMVIAGPGSGKTRCLTLRAMNLLLLKKASPQEMVLCTYTEKAAFEMQDRLSSIARRVGYSEDIAQIRIGTIHGICNSIIAENLHRLPAPDQQMPPLGNNYETLDRISQGLFIFENLEAICGRSLQFFANRWGSRWAIVKQLQKYFEKITEELIAIRLLLSEPGYLLQNLAHAYREYQRLLVKNNCLDFAHLQKMAYWLLHDPRTASPITRDVGYVLVDEYQDFSVIEQYKLTIDRGETYQEQRASSLETLFLQHAQFQLIKRLERVDMVSCQSFPYTPRPGQMDVLHGATEEGV